jgi:VWFA-related protein
MSNVDNDRWRILMKMQLSGIIPLLFLGVFCWGQKTKDPLPQGRENPAIKADVSLVPVDVMVRNKEGSFVGDLQAGDFVVYDNGVAQKIELFNHEEMPLDVALVVDNSESVLSYNLELQNAAKALLQQLDMKNDRAALFCTGQVSWSGGYAYQLAGLTRDRLLLEHQLGKTPFMSTGMWPSIAAVDIGSSDVRDRIGGLDVRNSIWEAALYLRTKGSPQRRRAIILISARDEGAWQNSQIFWDQLKDSPYLAIPHSSKETLDEMLEANTIFYSIRPAIKRPTFDELYIQNEVKRRWWHQNFEYQSKNPIENLKIPSLNDFVKNLVSQLPMPTSIVIRNENTILAKETGGDLLNVTAASDIPNALKTAILNLKHTYTLGFYPSDKGTEGSYHKLMVQLNSRPNYSTQARTGYYVPKSTASAIAQKVQASDSHSHNTNTNDEYMNAMERSNFHSRIPRPFKYRKPDFFGDTLTFSKEVCIFERLLLHDRVDWVKGKLSQNALKYGLKHIDFAAVAKSHTNPEDKLNIDLQIDAAQLFFDFFDTQYRAFVYVCVMHKSDPIGNVMTFLVNYPEEKTDRVFQSKVSLCVTMDPPKHKDLRVLVFQLYLPGEPYGSWGIQPAKIQP